jgi:RNA polymerase sigma factor (sigma-70 family)
MPNPDLNIVYSKLQDNEDDRDISQVKDLASSIQSEQQLWTAFVKGDEVAFSRLYQATFYELFDYGIKLCHHSELVKDSLHDLFIDLWKYRRKPSRINSIRPYLYKALRNIILKAQSRRHPFRKIEEGYNFTIDVSSETLLIQYEDNLEERHKLHRALEELTQRQREVIFLKFYSQLSYDEVASILGISTKATYKLVSRSIACLREKMIPLSLIIALLAKY